MSDQLLYLIEVQQGQNDVYLLSDKSDMLYNLIVILQL